MTRELMATIDDSISGQYKGSFVCVCAVVVVVVVVEKLKQENREVVHSCSDVCVCLYVKSSPPHMYTLMARNDRTGRRKVLGNGFEFI